MIYTPTTLRKSIYAVLDQVLETGVPAIIERDGKRLKIVPDQSIGRLERLVSHDCITGNIDDLPDVHFASSWSQEPEL